MGRRGIVFKYFSISSPTIKCRMLQPRTELHIVKTEISGEQLVTASKKNQSCSLVLTMALLLLKCSYGWTGARGFWVQVPTRSVIFSLIKK